MYNRCVTSGCAAGAMLACAVWRCAALPADSASLGGWLRLHGTGVVAGIDVVAVMAGAGLAQAGVEPGDAIIAANAATLTGLPPGAVHAALSAASTNASFLLLILRGTNAPRLVGISNTVLHAPLMGAARPSTVDTLVAAQLAGTAGLPLCFDTVTNILSRNVRHHADAWLHPLSATALSYPQHTAALAARMGRATLRAARRGDWPRALAGLAFPTVCSCNFTDILAHTEQPMQRALAQLSSQDLSRIVGHAPVLAEQFDRFFYLHDDPVKPRYLESCRMITAAQQLDASGLRAACASLCAAAHRALTHDWRALPVNPALSLHGCSGLLRAVLTTSVGLVVVGGDGPNTYDPGPPFIIDPGGDDTYHNRRAAWPDRCVSLVVDLAGADEYTSTGALAVAAGIAGVDVIVDACGNDYYACPVLGVGAGVCGIGTLIDLAGDDRYLGERFVQGAGLFGTGVILDTAGDDSYLALRFAQAIGLAGGDGRLCDTDGNDIYAALLGTPSVYGMPGVYNSFSQGAGVGFRLIAAGGVGLLVDGRGNDRYESGEFAQGVGYYLGAGILYDAAGDDCYRATRYCQAAAAHTALGVLLDMSGHDRYDGRVTAVQGAAWDASVAVFRDYAGHDRYSSAGLALGTACMGSYAEFVDLRGNDVYRLWPGEAPGVSWLRPGETNCAIFIDAHGHDSYVPAAAHSNNMQTITGDCGVFYDGEASTHN